MTNLFLRLVNQSIAASWLIGAVLVLRLALKKAPKRFSVMLWGLVAVRALCPFSLKSVFSLMPRAQAIGPDIMMSPNPQIDSGVGAVNRVVNPVLAASFTPAPAASANPLQIWLPVLACLWLAGAAGMALYTLVSYVQLRRRMRTAVCLRDNIYCSEGAPSPFLLGVLRPRIYLPFHMAESAQEAAVAHEQAHIRRGDHWWKPLGFAVLALHWMNPLMWLAYALLCRDIELACDEHVIQEMDSAHRADYSEALLACSVNGGRGRRPLALRACPLTFSEGNVKTRIKAVLGYRKPAVWLVAAAVTACVLAAVCFLTDPAGAADGLAAGTVYYSKHCAYMSPLSSFMDTGQYTYTYTIEENALVITLPDDAPPTFGPMHGTYIPVSSWIWQPFPFTDEEWNERFLFELPDSLQNIHEAFEELLYLPMNSHHFMIRADGTLYLVEFGHGGREDLVWSMYELTPQKPLINHDLTEAEQMIQRAEWLCAWLQTQDSISRADAKKFIADLDAVIPGDGTNTLLSQMADAAEWEDPFMLTFALRHDVVVPTIFHEGVSIVSATEERNCTLEQGEDTCSYHNSTLRIRKEYTGSDPAFAGWFIEYIFTRRGHDDPWTFTAFNGTHNVEAALPLKEAFSQIAYPLF